ncbi:hypothetical protein BK127_13450 [Paenibacillus sp. FSL H7-0331]|nr:hypothetical protein BK127_13450 [Paenibacillus sp. FSL H7-0331]
MLRDKGFDAINRTILYAHYEDKYALLEDITEQAFHEMIPEQVHGRPAYKDHFGHDWLSDLWRSALLVNC